MAPGDNFGSVALGADPVQPTTDAEATMVRVAKPAAVSLAPNPVPAAVVRVFMGLPIAAADGGPFRGRITVDTGGEAQAGLLPARVGRRQLPRKAPTAAEITRRP